MRCKYWYTLLGWAIRFFRFLGRACSRASHKNCEASLPEGLAISAQLYSQQLERLYAALFERYPALVNRNRVLLQQYNARPHTAHLTQEKIAELGRGGHRALAPSSSQFRPCAIGLPPIPVPVDGSFPAWTALREWRSIWRDLPRVLRLQATCNLQPAWYRHGIEQLAERWKIADDHQSQWTKLGWLSFWVDETVIEIIAESQTEKLIAHLNMVHQR